MEVAEVKNSFIETTNTDFEVRSLDSVCINTSELKHPGWYKLKFTKGQVHGGLLFGFGWAITGACPGPLFALIGSGTTVIIVTLLSAVAGTWAYGYLREKLPH